VDDPTRIYPLDIDFFCPEGMKTIEESELILSLSQKQTWKDTEGEKA
jgi:hypothetical protein